MTKNSKSPCIQNSLFYVDLVVAIAHIKLGDEAHPTATHRAALQNHWNQELVFECLVVQHTVVDAETPRTIADEEDWGGEGRGARVDDSLL
jgi:hypothetical protein